MIVVKPVRTPLQHPLVLTPSYTQPPQQHREPEGTQIRFCETIYPLGVGVIEGGGWVNKLLGEGASPPHHHEVGARKHFPHERESGARVEGRLGPTKHPSLSE